MSIEDDPDHPLWSTHDSANPPKELYAGYYLGLTGERWLATSYAYTEDPARFITAQLDRPAKILKYVLVEEEDFPMEERMKYRRKKPWHRKKGVEESDVQEKPVKEKKPIRVRKVRKPK